MPVIRTKLVWLLPVAVCGILAVYFSRDRSDVHHEDPARPLKVADVVRQTGRAESVSLSFSKLSGKPDSSKTSLADLENSLKSLPQDEALREIRDFLHSGRDKETGLPFEIGREGNLTSWPTFRVYLLDLLAEIDPAAAGEIGKEILGTPTTADEWALAMRNLGRVERSAEGDKFLREKAVELIENPDWQADPSVGYLNAFDVLVHTDATGETPLLSSLIQRKDRKDLAHAGFLTLDRLVQRQPVDELVLLAADKSLLESRPEMVAQQFARADLRDSDQRNIVKSWLLDPARTPTELRSFTSVYPNNNRFVSNNLLTTEPPQAGTDLAAHDREALEIVKSWQADPEFESIASELAAMERRLAGFVQVPTSSER